MGRRSTALVVLSTVVAATTLVPAAGATPESDTRTADGPPALSLPFRYGEKWTFWGLHPQGGSSGDVYNAIDFAGFSRRVTAAAAGTVHLFGCPAGQMLVIDHGNGYWTQYYHVVNFLVEEGQHVDAGDDLADTGTALPCGGTATTPHVHFSLWHFDGTPDWRPSAAVELDGLTMSGWTFHRGNDPYSGGATAPNGTRVASREAISHPFVERLGGLDRYETAALVSSSRFTTDVDTVFIATGENFPDALAATPAAARLRGPILLVASGGIPAPTASELLRLAPRRIVVLGGPAAVSDAVVTSLDTYTSGAVERWAGADRFGTAAEVVRQAFPLGAEVLYLADGGTYGDALVAGARAATVGAPLLLADAAGLPAASQAMLTALDPRQIVIMSSSGNLPNLEAQLATFADAQLTRISDSDPPSLSAQVASAYVAGTSSYVATSLEFPDALTGGVPAAIEGSALLLVPRRCLPTAVASQIRRLRGDRLTILGGPYAVFPAIEVLGICP